MNGLIFKISLLICLANCTPPHSWSGGSGLNWPQGNDCFLHTAIHPTTQNATPNSSDSKAQGLLDPTAF